MVVIVRVSWCGDDARLLRFGTGVWVCSEHWWDEQSCQRMFLPMAVEWDEL